MRLLRISQASFLFQAMTLCSADGAFELLELLSIFKHYKLGLIRV